MSELIKALAPWKNLMGDDGTGHCRGCGNPLDRINVDCEVCLAALKIIADQDADDA